MAYISEFSKHCDPDRGYTYDEALEKQAVVNEAHGVFNSEAKWNRAEIVRDVSKKTGYKVVIRAK